MGYAFDLDIGTIVLSNYDAEGHPQAQVDAYGEGDSGVQPYELHHFFGFFAIPDEPELDPLGEVVPHKACQALYAVEGLSGNGHVWALGDPRMIAKLPRGTKRTSYHYGGNRARPSFQQIDGESGSYMLYVPYTFSGTGDDATPGKAMTVQVDVRDAGAESISLVHGEGMSVSMTAGGKNTILVKNKDGSAFVEVNDDGVIINGTALLGSPTGTKPLVVFDEFKALMGTVKIAIEAASVFAPGAKEATDAALALFSLQLDAVASKLVRAA